MNRTKLGGENGLEVSQCGMGTMSITAYYGDPMSDDDAIELIRAAVEEGCTFFDTAESYTAEHPETKEKLWNEEILGRAVATIGRDKVQVGTKFSGEAAASGPARAEFLERACVASLKRLQMDSVDLYYLHRVDTNVPIEETVEGMAKLVQAGLVGHIGLSEASPEVIRRAHAVHPIACVQQEWSLYTRDLEEDIVPTCKELGIGIVAYSPLGRGFLSDDMVTSPWNPDQGDWRAGWFPRLAGEAFEANKTQRAKAEAMAKAKGCHTAELSLAWLWAQAAKLGVDVVPIPGTTRIRNLQSNCRATNLVLSDQERGELASVFDDIVGQRGNKEYMDTTYRALQPAAKR